MVVYYIKGDLFDVPKKYALAHCIAADALMGGWIAVDFRLKFKQQTKILSYLKKFSHSNQIGICVPLKFGNTWIYNLITKHLSHKKPILKNLEKSLIDMKKHMIANKVYNLAMPKIGAGIDRLPWEKVIDIVYELFKGDEFKVVIFYL